MLGVAKSIERQPEVINKRGPPVLLPQECRGCWCDNIFLIQLLLLCLLNRLSGDVNDMYSYSCQQRLSQ
jgi:hypothetical protein